MPKVAAKKPTAKKKANKPAAKKAAANKPAANKPAAKKSAGKKPVNAKLAELRRKAREHRAKRVVDPRFATKLTVIRSLADVEKYRAARAAGREPRIDAGQITLHAQSWNPALPMQRLERLVVATAMVQTGALQPVFVKDVWSLWAGIPDAAPKHAAKQAALLQAIGFATLADAKAHAQAQA